MIDDDDRQVVNVASKTNITTSKLQNMISEEIEGERDYELGEAVGPGEDHEMTIENNSSHTSSDNTPPLSQKQQQNHVLLQAQQSTITTTAFNKK